MPVVPVMDTSIPLVPARDTSIPPVPVMITSAPLVPLRATLILLPGVMVLLIFAISCPYAAVPAVPTDRVTS